MFPLVRGGFLDHGGGFGVGLAARLWWMDRYGGVELSVRLLFEELVSKWWFLNLVVLKIFIEGR